MKPIASLLLIFALLFTTMSYVFAQQTDLLYGDVDGDQKIAAADALAVLQTVVGKRQLTPQQEILADVSGDKEVQADDALWILKYVVGKTMIFPAADQPNGAFGLTQAQMDEFAPLLEGLFTGDTTEVIEMEGMGSDFAMHFPDIVYRDGQYYAYYITYQTNNGKGGVGLAISTDGETWINQGCVLQPDQDYDCNGAYFAGVWADPDGKVYLTYECKGGEGTAYGTLENIALAMSEDGYTFKKEGVILYKNTALSWQKANIGTPDLHRANGVWYMTFHGFDYTDCQMGLAYGTDLHNLTMVETPIIPTVSGTPYSGTAGRRDIIYVDGVYYMVFEVSTDAVANGGYGGAYWSHMFARSTDMIHWEINEKPLLTQTDDQGNAKTGFGYDGPCWCVKDGELYVYMRVGASTTGVKLVGKQ